MFWTWLNIKLTHLKRGITKYGLAPHKPVLLITLLELIGNGHLNINRIYVDTERVGTIQENWRLLISTPNQPISRCLSFTCKMNKQVTTRFGN